MLLSVSDLCRLKAVLKSSEMVPPVQVSPLIKTARWSALLVGIIYGKRRYDNLKPIAEEERRIEEEEKKVREEQERIAKQLAEANEDTILK
ncbi:ATP synthase membrane subunit eb [Danio aesculapii]|uniref:ATP synthase membrane subunit eb n=1 Tax=Danio aesculapii TaxID=1142201 RepID=UPI0024BF4B2B|nr:ATP synthase membrane subunit eb [Danio aesculapii]